MILRLWGVDKMGRKVRWKDEKVDHVFLACQPSLACLFPLWVILVPSIHPFPILYWDALPSYSSIPPLQCFLPCCQEHSFYPLISFCQRLALHPFFTFYQLQSLYPFLPFHHGTPLICIPMFLPCLLPNLSLSLSLSLSLPIYTHIYVYIPFLQLPSLPLVLCHFHPFYACHPFLSVLAPPSTSLPS